MSAERYASIVDVHVILRRRRQILLLRRAGDTWATGQLCLPSGHLEEGESILGAGPRHVPPSCSLPSATSALSAASLLEHARQVPGLFRLPASGDGLAPGNSCSSDRSVPAAFPALVVIRGNSASGKSAVAAAIRARHAARDLAIVSQDTLRRDVLREHDIPCGANINLLKLIARHAANCGFNVIVEGILRTDHYGAMLAELISGHPGPAFAYYLDIPFGETLLRHASKPQAAEYGESEMRGWYRERDLLPGGIEHVIAAESSLEDTVRTIMTATGLGAASQNPDDLP